MALVLSSQFGRLKELFCYLRLWFLSPQTMFLDILRKNLCSLCFTNKDTQGLKM